ncbi:M20 family metallopeptidase [Peribacillus castrilensis]|uniref:Amidohydrolase n=1 Tax=Peribacillus simplex TaxID=1478 RepID=A0AAN2PHU8_9BACI|nr:MULTISPECIES: M20 family metallopeptidase [Bacillaceae]MCP1094600.1 M20 family metallopeptidase [Bacillaceae bacterium OS4b]MBD8589540.1 amidohydrolase [Peribacillus simplex]MCF7622865.1 M20 family metallopeptidase [Peribacillus frigoritolerans]MCT1389078.1 M20 family metallopeptidase [Peribacillus frigoritolerans]MEA3573313.1 M20 family metallopeptidase [Peribacillus frigoritolerans]
MLDQLLQKLEEKKERMIEIRRYLHQHPELSFKEEKTAQYIADFYKDKSVIIRTNVGGYGVVVTIEGGLPGKTVALRADFDGLPIMEEADVPFKSSNPGVMHACGHDGHTAYLMILAEALIEMKDQLRGNVVILHQPAEETPPGGAIAMIEDGCLEGVDSIFGIHLMSLSVTGEVCYRAGEMQAGRSYFKVKIQGKGGHGSMPHTSNDSIVAASHFVVAAQTIISRRINPFDMATVTIGSFDGKGSFNVIKDSVELEGDVRTMSSEVRAKVETEFKRILAGLAQEFDITYDLIYSHDYPVLVNDKAMTELVVNGIKNAAIPEVKALVETPPTSGSEDFAYYLQKIPGSMFYVGAMPDDGPVYPHHHPKFVINEDSLIIAAKAMAAVVAEYFGQK